MAKAKKLPSGSWRCQIYSHTEEIPQADGSVKKKRIYKSFFCDDPSPHGKRTCEKEAALWAASKETEKRSRMTFGIAVQKYIESRENVLSPGTIVSYKAISKNYLAPLYPIDLYSLRRDDAQNLINTLSITHSPKTLRNVNGLISAVLRTYRPEFALNLTLPARKRADLYIPTDDDVKRLIREVSGSEMELPVLLAAFGPMRGNLRIGFVRYLRKYRPCPPKHDFK